jgi:hypothetical protein
MAGDEIVMGRNATMMIHDGFGMGIGNAADLRDLADLLDKTSDNIASIYAERTGKDASYWRALMRDETWYDADEAVAAGLADSVQTPQKKAPENSWDLSVFNHRPETADPKQPALSQPVQSPVFTLSAEDFRLAVKEAIASE